MKTTMTMAATMNCSPFAIMDEDTDEVIMTINFYVALSNSQPQEVKEVKKDNNQRIRVNDKTATGGWF